MIKKILSIILTAIILGGSVFLASFAGKEHRRTVYRAFSLSIDNPQEQPLVTEEELLDTLSQRFGTFEGRNLDAVPLYEIEQFLVSNPYVERTNLYATLTGDMVASVITRVPMARIINIRNESCLVDTAGVAMPLSPSHPVRVIVASGHIEARFDTLRASLAEMERGNILREVYDVTRWVSRDRFLEAFIGQVYVNEKQEMELMPRIGDQTILLGTGENAQEKLVRLREFYLQVVRYTGWDKYDTINLTFDNQVVCTK